MRRKLRYLQLPQNALQSSGLSMVLSSEGSGPWQTLRFAARWCWCWCTPRGVAGSLTVGQQLRFGRLACGTDQSAEAWPLWPRYRVLPPLFLLHVQVQRDLHGDVASTLPSRPARLSPPSTAGVLELMDSACAGPRPVMALPHAKLAWHPAQHCVRVHVCTRLCACHVCSRVQPWVCIHVVSRWLYW